MRGCPVASLAKTLRVARGTVQNRLARMEKDGTIVGYTVKLKPQDEDQRIRALMTVAVEGNRTDEVLRALRGDPAVAALHTTNGRWDIVAELRSDSLEAVDRVLSRIRLIDGISNTETSLLLSTHKYLATCSVARNTEVDGAALAAPSRLDVPAALRQRRQIPGLESHGLPQRDFQGDPAIDGDDQQGFRARRLHRDGLDETLHAGRHGV